MCIFHRWSQESLSPHVLYAVLCDRPVEGPIPLSLGGPCGSPKLSGWEKPERLREARCVCSVGLPAEPCLQCVPAQVQTYARFQIVVLQIDPSGGPRDHGAEIRHLAKL